MFSFNLRTLPIVSGFPLLSRPAYAGPQTIAPFGGPNLPVLLFLFWAVVVLVVVALIAGPVIWLGVEVRKVKKAKASGHSIRTTISFRQAVVEAFLWLAFAIFAAAVVFRGLFI